MHINQDSGIGQKVQIETSDDKPPMHKADLTIITKICKLPKPENSFTAALALVVIYVACGRYIM